MPGLATCAGMHYCSATPGVAARVGKAPSITKCEHGCGVQHAYQQPFKIKVPVLAGKEQHIGSVGSNTYGVDCLVVASETWVCRGAAIAVEVACRADGGSAAVVVRFVEELEDNACTVAQCRMPSDRRPKPDGIF